MPTSQSRTSVSSSVIAGPVCQSIPCTPSPAESSSPRIDGSLMLAGKNANQLGLCQWASPGTITSSMSRSMSSKGSPVGGGSGGRAARTSPGATRESTGRSSQLAR